MNTPEPATHYVCDPSINTECRKTNCWINGGPCRHTRQLQFAKQPVEKVKLVIPMSKTDAVELGFVKEED